MSAIKDFVNSLDASQRNILKVALATEDGVEELRGELRIYSKEQHTRNLALQGRTIELFDRDTVRELAPSHSRVQATKVMIALGNDGGTNV